MTTLIRSADALTVPPATHAEMPKARRVLFIRPTHFNLDTPINAHMRAKDGSMHKLDHSLALSQWDALVDIYRKLGLEVHLREGAPGLPDHVFSANHALPLIDRTGRRIAMLSRMANANRVKEVPFTENFLKTQGYDIQNLTKAEKFEGMGDCLWLPGRRFLLGGYGFRTSQEAYAEIAAVADAPIALFELKEPKFYHLDTCLSILTQDAALACRAAFTPEGWELVRKIFPRLIEVSADEADAPGFACNAHCPDEKHVIIQRGCHRTTAALRAAGFEPIETDTAEFIKSGGSVFCMKLMFF